MDLAFIDSLRHHLYRENLAPTLSPRRLAGSAVGGKGVARLAVAE
jgi:hypothetical protein